MAEALRCAGCGASFPAAAPEVASVPCPSCGFVNRVAGDALSEIFDHRRAVGRERERAEQAIQRAATDEVTRSLGRGWAAALILAWIIAGVFALPERPATTALAVLIALAPIAALIAVSARRHRAALERLRKTATAELSLIVHCPGCGGQSELRPGAPVDACRYCGGALGADRQELASMLRAAEARATSEARKAQISSWRLAAHQNRDMRQDLVPVVTFGAIAGPMVLGIWAVTIRELIVPGEGPGAATVLGFNLFALLLAAIPITLLVRIRRRARRWTELLMRVSERSGSALERELAAYPQWLAAHWLASLPARWICAGRDYALLHADAPTPWLLSIAPQALAEQLVEAHVRLLIPGEPSKTLLARYRSELELLGLRCELREGGLVAALSGDAVEQRAPELLERLAPWLHELGEREAPPVSDGPAD